MAVPLADVHDIAIREAVRLLERAVDSAPSANVVTGF
jgi:hypothetical protein